MQCHAVQPTSPRTRACRLQLQSICRTPRIPTRRTDSRSAAAAERILMQVRVRAACSHDTCRARSCRCPARQDARHRTCRAQACSCRCERCTYTRRVQLASSSSSALASASARRGPPVRSCKRPAHAGAAHSNRSGRASTAACGHGDRRRRGVHRALRCWRSGLHGRSTWSGAEVPRPLHGK